MIVTLRQAYEEWAAAPSHRSLYHSTRDVFRKLFPILKMNILCSECTLPRVAEAFGKLDLVKADKVSPASVLCHVLNYAHEQNPGGCPEIDFTYDKILDYDENQRDAAEIRASLDDPEPAFQEKPKKTPPRNRQSVVQIDAETEKPIRTFGSISQAEKEIGVKNIRRAVKQHAMAGGFYWCEAGAESSFVPKKRLVPLKVDKAALAAAPEAPEVPAYISDSGSVNKFKKGDHVWSRLKDHAGMTGTVVDVYFDTPQTYGVNFCGSIWRMFETDLEPVDEERFASRIPPKISEPEQGNAPAGPDLPEIALANFSNEEILDEIRRRGWKGNVSFMTTFQI